MPADTGPRSPTQRETNSTSSRADAAAAAGNRAGRGCAFIYAAEAHLGSAEALAAKDFRSWLHELFTLLVAAARYQNVPTLSLQLVLLFDGSNIAAQLDANPEAAQAARTAAEALLSTAPRA
jgi:hypothetical protein